MTNVELDGVNKTMWDNYVRPHILKRDNYECQRCKNKSRLEVHHIKKGIQTAQNLITLCFKCHRSEHKTIQYYPLKENL